MAIAEAFVDKGWQVSFAINPQTQAAMFGLGLERLECLPMAGPQEGEIEQLQKAFAEGVDLFVVDHYGRDAEFERACRPWAKRILVLDDKADRAHDADFLVDSLPGRNQADYANAGANARLLLGPSFAPVRPAIRQRRKQALLRRRTTIRLDRVLIAPGGCDACNLAELYLNGLLASGFDGKIDLLLGAASPHLLRIKESVQALGDRVRLHIAAPDVATLLEEADLCLGAAGGSSWERCCLGLPSMTVVTADNQIRIAEAVALSGAAINLGWHAGVTPAKVAATLAPLLAEPSLLASMRRAAFQLCDGLGIWRLAEFCDSGEVSGWLGRPKRISVLVDNDSWVLPFAAELVELFKLSGEHATLCRTHDDITEGDIAFFLGCVRITPPQILSRNRQNLVVHASDLPKGRGFSPLTWLVLEGQRRIPVCLIEAAEMVDEGDILAKKEFSLAGHELIGDMRELLGQATLDLCLDCVLSPFPSPRMPQTGAPSYYSRRSPKDSRLDPTKSIADQFDLLRTVDNEKYPAFFEWRGHTYRLRIDRVQP
jgi:UDP-2,4-diacetamido-2,4,6-trideoxy-beta-L-altropyranose hydrolase